jgi:subtilisin family serine protease
MRHRTLLPAAAALLLLTGLAQARSGPADAATTTPAATGGSRTATLITGDRVTLTPDGGVSIRAGSGRAKIPMLTSTVSGHVRVIPADALPLLKAGRLDPRLFDVTGLLADGYDDRRADLPVIASTGSGVTGTVVHRMTAVKATALHTRKRDLGQVWAAMKRTGNTGKVWLDAVGHFTGAEGVQQIGATEAWQAGYTGQGMTVALIDSGVDVTHPDLAGKVTAQVDFSPVADGGAPTSTDVHDLQGHGTGVASIMAGTGAASDGRYRGVAPDAAIVSAKVGDWDVAESSVIAAMEWAAGTEHAKVVNMSLGFPDAPGNDPVETALNDLTQQDGTLFVVAAGNSGNDGDNPTNDYEVTSPGTADDALTVGAVDHDDQVAAFSSRGPRLGDDAIKPDITAPGVDVTVARSVDATFPGSGPYATEWGTSEAAPHAAAAAILLKQAHPDWTPAALKAALMGTARPAPGVGVFAQGAGRVDVFDALSDPVLADPPSLSLGSETAAQTSDLSGTVTYRNLSPTTQKLQLAVGAPFRLSRSSLTVPAGGTAPVKVTAPASATTAVGPHTGQLTATTAAGKAVTTPVGLVRENNGTHTLTVHNIDRDGAPAQGFATTVIGLDTTYFYETDLTSVPPGSDFSISVPAGHYAVTSQVFNDEDTGAPSITVEAAPDLAVEQDTAVTFDARAAAPVRVGVPTAGAVTDADVLQLNVRNGDGAWRAVGSYVSAPYQLYTAQIGDNGDAGRFVSGLQAGLSDSSDPSAYSYQLAWYWPGTLPTGFTRTVTGGQLAVDRTSTRAPAPAGETEMQVSSAVPGYPLPPVYLSAPLAPTRYFNTGGGLRWTSQVAQYSDDDVDYDDVTTTGPPITYQPGKSYASDWNAPIVAPCPVAGGGWSGDQLTVRVAPYCDGAGHPGYVEQETAAGTTTLYRDGTEVATSDVPGHALFTAQPAPGTYLLDVDATRAASFGLSTHITTDWTFTDPATAAHLPAVRMTPAVNGVLPITVAATAVRLQISTDDGATWRPAPVTRTGTGTFQARITNPASGYVSLKVTATGGAAAITETVVHAYQVGS